MSAPPQSRATISIGDDVEILTEQITALKDLALKYPSNNDAANKDPTNKDPVREDERYDLSIRWGAALAGRLPRLVHYSALGMLDEADESRFQTLCAELRALADLIDRFDLARPMFADTAKRRREPRWSSSRRGSAQLPRRG
jgi:hypothetical protein